MASVPAFTPVQTVSETLSAIKDVQDGTAHYHSIRRDDVWLGDRFVNSADAAPRLIAAVRLTDPGASLLVNLAAVADSSNDDFYWAVSIDPPGFDPASVTWVPSPSGLSEYAFGGNAGEASAVAFVNYELGMIIYQSEQIRLYSDRTVAMLRNQPISNGYHLEGTGSVLVVWGEPTTQSSSANINSQVEVAMSWTEKAG